MRKQQDRMASKGHPNPVDVYVGARIRARRKEIGRSLEAIAPELGVRWQQLHKYERADNRVSASRLYDLSIILGVDIAYFFEGMPDEIKAQRPSALNGAIPPAVQHVDERGTRAITEIVKACTALSPKKRSAVRNLLRVMRAA